MTLTVLIITLVQSAEHDDIVGSLGLLHSLLYQLLRRTLIIEVLTRGHTIIIARHITHISTGKVHLYALLLHTGPQALQRRYLMLHLQA